jgi:hypothetical protein
MPWKTVSEAAHELGVGTDAVVERVKSGKIRARGSGEYMMVSIDQPVRPKPSSAPAEPAEQHAVNGFGEDVNRVREWGYFQTALGAVSQAKNVFEEEARRAHRRVVMLSRIAITAGAITLAAVLGFVASVLSYHDEIRDLSAKAAFQEGESEVLQADVDLAHQYLDRYIRSLEASMDSSAQPVATDERLQKEFDEMRSELSATRQDRDRFLKSLLILSKERHDLAQELEQHESAAQSIQMAKHAHLTMRDPSDSEDWQP